MTEPAKIVDAEHQAVKRALYQLNSLLGARHNTSVAFAFAMLAMRNVAPGGSVGLILPLTAMVGAPPQQTLHPPKNINWQNLRNKLTEGFTDVTVVSIANYSEERSSFCHNSVTADVMLIARRLKPGETPTGRATFVNLHRGPATTQESAALADEIRSAGQKHDNGQDCAALALNEDNIGYALRAQVEMDRPWLMTRILDPRLIAAKSNLANGIIAITGSQPAPAPAPRRRTAVLSTGNWRPGNRLPMTTFGHLGRMHEAQPTLGREFGSNYEAYTHRPDQVPVLHGTGHPDQGRFLVVPADAVHTSPDQGRGATALVWFNTTPE